MKFEVYCDENRPDLFSSEKSRARYMTIGSLWLAAEDRGSFKEAIHSLRDKHHVGGDFKWRKVSPSRLAFYEELIDWFIERGDALRFRCIAIDKNKVNLLHYHENDQELGFYKFYYQLLHHWILDFNEYAVFCDFKNNRRRDRLHVLRTCLDSSNLSSTISNVQAIRAKESVLIQLADLLTGAAAARLNDALSPHGSKQVVVERLEKGLRRTIGHTLRSEQKFNVFVINLQGGW